MLQLYTWHDDIHSLVQLNTFYIAPHELLIKVRVYRKKDFGRDWHSAAN